MAADKAATDEPPTECLTIQEESKIEESAAEKDFELAEHLQMEQLPTELSGVDFDVAELLYPDKLPVVEELPDELDAEGLQIMDQILQKGPAVEESDDESEVLKIASLNGEPTAPRDPLSTEEKC